MTVEQLTSFLIHTCKSRHYKLDDFSIEGGSMLYLASESIVEKAYYLLTALIKEDDNLIQVMLRAASAKPHGLNGFLNETVAELQHVVETVQSAREIGVIKKEQVINIIDSVLQRTTFGGGEGTASVNIKDSLVQRTEFKGGDERKKREEERRRREREEQERLQKEEEAQKREKEDQEQRLRFKEQQEKTQREKKLHEEAERREKEKTKQEEELLRRQIKDREKIVKENEETIGEEVTKTSRNKFFAVGFVIGLLSINQKLWCLPKWKGSLK